MCFSNLPVEFDEEGNPYLADEAEDVERPGVEGAACDCAGAAGEAVDLEADPEGSYEAIVDALPDAARDHVGGTDRPTRAESDAGSAEGD